MTSNEIEIGPIHRGARISVRKTTDGARLDKVYHHPAMTLSPHRSPVTVTTIADIFDLPERVHQGDFVLRLAEGVERPEQTLGDYVVTEQLARCFDAALFRCRAVADRQRCDREHQQGRLPARQLRQRQEPLHGGADAAAAPRPWCALGSGWDAAGFDAALEAPPRDDERLRLIGDLIDAFFTAARTVDAADGERFVPLDEGLSVMSRHAQALGYDALILFLDELVLRLASHAAEPAFVNREGQKVAKLVEAMQSDRPIPIVSFIARQRDLRELVGEHLPGAGQLGFADVLNWWEARFDTITLEDRNLPDIVERRVLRTKNAAAREELAAAFEKTARVREEVLSTLLTRDGDRRMFRQIYPCLR